MTKWKIFLHAFFLLFASCHVNEHKYLENEPAKLIIKKNNDCSRAILCVRAEFWLNDMRLQDNGLTIAMDKEIGKSFYMITQKDTSYPISAERMNGGITGEVVYLLYFIDTIVAGKGVQKIKYDGKFYGIKSQEFMIH